MPRYAWSPGSVSSPMRECFLNWSRTPPHISSLFSYDIFAINIASTMLGYVYGKNQKLNKSQDLGVKVATPVGTLVGQVLFGWLADVVGRKRMCKSFTLSDVICVSLIFLQMVSSWWSWSSLPLAKPSLAMLQPCIFLVSLLSGGSSSVSP